MHFVVNLDECIELARVLQSRMTTAWIKQSPGLYRAAKEKGSCTILTGGWRNAEDKSRDCTRWCNSEEK
jgi:hypothetical protein